jgi:hypothetical protein
MIGPLEILYIILCAAVKTRIKSVPHLDDAHHIYWCGGMEIKKKTVLAARIPSEIG